MHSSDYETLIFDVMLVFIRETDGIRHFVQLLIDKEQSWQGNIHFMHAIRLEFV
jgi:hypothetical protein